MISLTLSFLPESVRPLNSKTANASESEKPKRKGKPCGQCENKAALLVRTLQQIVEQNLRWVSDPPPSSTCFGSHTPCLVARVKGEVCMLLGTAYNALKLTLHSCLRHQLNSSSLPWVMPVSTQACCSIFHLQPQLRPQQTLSFVPHNSLCTSVLVTVAELAILAVIFVSSLILSIF